MIKTPALRPFALAVVIGALATLSVPPQPVHADEPQTICGDAVGLRLRARHDKWAAPPEDWDFKVLRRALDEAVECRRQVHDDAEAWADATLLIANIEFDFATYGVLLAQYSATVGGRDFAKAQRDFLQAKSLALEDLRRTKTLLEQIETADARGIYLGDFDLSVVRNNKDVVADTMRELKSFTFGRKTVYQLRHERELAGKTAPRGTDENPDVIEINVTPAPLMNPTPQASEDPTRRRRCTPVAIHGP